MSDFFGELRKAVEKVDGNEVALVLYWTKDDILNAAHDAGYKIDDYDNFIREVNDSDSFPVSGEDLINSFAYSMYCSVKEKYNE